MLKEQTERTGLQELSPASLARRDMRTGRPFLLADQITAEEAIARAVTTLAKMRAMQLKYKLRQEDVRCAVVWHDAKEPKRGTYFWLSDEDSVTRLRKELAEAKNPAIDGLLCAQRDRSKKGQSPEFPAWSIELVSDPERKKSLARALRHYTNAQLMTVKE